MSRTVSGLPLENDHEEHDNDCSDRCRCGAGGGDRDEDTGCLDWRDGMSVRDLWGRYMRYWYPAGRHPTSSMLPGIIRYFVILAVIAAVFFLARSVFIVWLSALGRGGR